MKKIWKVLAILSTGISSSYSASAQKQIEDTLKNTSVDGTGGGIIPPAPPVAGAS